MLKSTEKLLHNLCECESLEFYLNTNADELLAGTPTDFLISILQNKQLRMADVARLSGQGEYVYKALQGKRKASRNILISIAIGLQMDIIQAQHLLRLAGHARLDPRNRRDSILLYALNQTLPVEEINMLLFNFCEPTL